MMGSAFPMICIKLDDGPIIFLLQLFSKNSRLPKGKEPFSYLEPIPPMIPLRLAKGLRAAPKGLAIQRPHTNTSSCFSSPPDEACSESVPGVSRLPTRRHSGRKRTPCAALGRI